MQTNNVKTPHLHDLSQKLFALANVNRLSIIMYLQHREMNVGTLAECVDISQSALSQHLIKLKALGLVEARKDKQMRLYRLTNNALTAALLSFVSQQIPCTLDPGECVVPQK